MLRQTRRWLLDRSVHLDMSLRSARARFKTSSNGSAKQARIPRGFHHSTANWFRTLPAPKQSRMQMTSLYEGGAIDLVPVTNGPPDQRLVAHATCDVPPIFVVGVENGCVHDETGEVVAPDGKILADLSVMSPDHIQPWVKNLHRPFAMKEAPSTITKLGRACVLTTQYGAGNYFHWMLNALPRVHLYQRAGLDFSSIDAFVANELRSPFQVDSLERAGVDMSRVVTSGKGFCGESEMLFSTRSLRAAGHRCGWVRDYLRSLYSDSLAQNSGARLFVSRRDAVSRRLLNEDDVIGCLQEHDFQTVTLSDKTVSQQARLFSQASVIIAPHDAGLANIIFCNPNTHIIEMLSPNHIRSYYWELSSLMSLPYSVVVGECEDSAQSGDYRVAIDSLIEALKANGI